MKKEKLIILIKYTKILLALGATMAWILIIYNLSHSQMNFNEQAPYCMGSTMLIFMLLNACYKALDYYGKKQ